MKRTLVSLRLMSDTLEPEFLAAGLSTTVDARWRKGDQRANELLTHAENGVEIQAPGGGKGDLDEQLGLLMERVRPDVEHIRGLGCDSVQLAVIVYDSRPAGYHFDPEMIELLGRMGASIDVDQYLVDEGDG